eukprot:gene20713-22745_t
MEGRREAQDSSFEQFIIPMLCHLNTCMLSSPHLMLIAPVTMAPWPPRLQQLTATVAGLAADQKELRAAFTPPQGLATPQRQS